MRSCPLTGRGFQHHRPDPGGDSMTRCSQKRVIRTASGDDHPQPLPVLLHFLCHVAIDGEADNTPKEELADKAPPSQRFVLAISRKVFKLPRLLAGVASPLQRLLIGKAHVPPKSQAKSSFSRDTQQLQPLVFPIPWSGAAVRVSIVDRFAVA